MPHDHTSPAQPGPGFAEFVALIAFMMALTALSIDIMLVALPDIGVSFALDDPNDRQYVITAYLLGFAIGQPIYGPLSDWYGRKPMLYAGTALFIVGALLAVIAPDYTTLLLARGVQGLGAAAARVIAVAIVRDRFAGRGMSRVMSFVIMTFIIVPIIAPSIGTAVLLVGDWRWVFLALLVAAVVLLLWFGIRLPETLTDDNRMPLRRATLWAAVRLLVTDRQTFGYTVATGFIFGNLMAYVGSAEQMFVDGFGVGDAFPLYFGAVAAVMIPASMANARLVERLGMRRLSHLALVAQVVACGVVGLFGFPGDMPLAGFCAFLAVAFFCFGVMMPNFNAIAMEPLGRLAGTGSSFIGFYSTAAGAILGSMIGQAFDGTVQPFLIGYAILSVVTLLTVLATERGRLFQVTALSG
ncbi:MAG: multidrug effflux MFS transporter [Alphaproteobacteria bacterium]